MKFLVPSGKGDPPPRVAWRAEEKAGEIFIESLPDAAFRITVPLLLFSSSQLVHFRCTERPINPVTGVASAPGAAIRITRPAMASASCS
ncbi:MAG: hypothetical protein WCO44_05795 [Bacteroidota bacterium]